MDPPEYHRLREIYCKTLPRNNQMHLLQSVKFQMKNNLLFNSNFGHLYSISRAHKNERLEEERVTPIEARSPGKIIEPQ